MPATERSNNDGWLHAGLEMRSSLLSDELVTRRSSTSIAVTDIAPGRPTSEHHRAPGDDLRDNYKKDNAALITKIHAALITGAEYQAEPEGRTPEHALADLENLQ